MLGSLGLLGANVAGVDVQPLDYKQLGAVFLGAAFLRLMIYVNAHPLPEEIAAPTQNENNP